MGIEPIFPGPTRRAFRHSSLRACDYRNPSLPSRHERIRPCHESVKAVGRSAPSFPSPAPLTTLAECPAARLLPEADLKRSPRLEARAVTLVGYHLAPFGLAPLARVFTE